MHLTPFLSGAHFGNLAKINGIIVWKLSPHEQKALPNFFDQAVPNTLRRIRSNILYVAPPFIIGYLIFTTCERRHVQLLRKNPAEFEDDE